MIAQILFNSPLWNVLLFAPNHPAVSEAIIQTQCNPAILKRSFLSLNRSHLQKTLDVSTKGFPLLFFGHSSLFLWLWALWQVWFTCIWVMPRADKPSCGNEIVSWQIAVFTALVLLDLTLFKCLLYGLKEILLGAVRHTQHRQCSGALTLLVPGVWRAVGCFLTSRGNRLLCACTENVLWHLQSTIQGLSYRQAASDMRICQLWHIVLKRWWKRFVFCQLLYVSSSPVMIGPLRHKWTEKCLLADPGCFVSWGATDSF